MKQKCGFYHSAVFSPRAMKNGTKMLRWWGSPLHSVFYICAEGQKEKQSLAKHFLIHLEGGEMRKHFYLTYNSRRDKVQICGQRRMSLWTKVLWAGMKYNHAWQWSRMREEPLSPSQTLIKHLSMTHEICRSHGWTKLRHSKDGLLDNDKSPDALHMV